MILQYLTWNFEACECQLVYARCMTISFYNILFYFILEARWFFSKIVIWVRLNLLSINRLVFPNILFKLPKIYIISCLLLPLHNILFSIKRKRSTYFLREIYSRTTHASNPSSWLIPDTVYKKKHFGRRSSAYLDPCRCIMAKIFGLKLSSDKQHTYECFF